MPDTTEAPGIPREKDACLATTQHNVHAQGRKVQHAQDRAAGGRRNSRVWAILEGFLEQVRLLQVDSRQKCTARGAKSTSHCMKALAGRGCACGSVWSENRGRIAANEAETSL